MALASLVSLCCSPKVKRRPPLNHRVFPPPPVLTSVINLSSPRSRILIPLAILIAILTLPNGNRRRGPRAPVMFHDGLCFLGQLLLLLPCGAVIPTVASLVPYLDIDNILLQTIDF